MATVAELGIRVAQEVGRPVYADAGVCQQLVLEAYADVVQRARLNPKSYTLTLVGGQSDYPLATAIPDLVLLRTVRYTPSGQERGDPLEPMAPVDARAALARASTAPGYSAGYALEGQTLIIVPAPASSGDVAFVFYDAAPDPVPPDQEPSLLPPHLHDALVWGACARDTTVHDVQRKAYYRQAFKDKMGDVVRWSTVRQGQRPRTAVLGGSVRVPRANDVYYSDGWC
jgi:hypothetical protein